MGCRWEGAAQRGTAWLGQALDPVRIEVQGKFTFVLVKVENRQGSSRLLVRGRQGCSQAALMQDVEKEVLFVLHALVHACLLYSFIQSFIHSFIHETRVQQVCVSIFVIVKVCVCVLSCTARHKPRHIMSCMLAEVNFTGRK